jgi:hypothetical protein
MEPPSTPASKFGTGSIRLSLATVALAAITVAGTTTPAWANEHDARISATRKAAIPKEWVGTWRLVSETLVNQDGAGVGSLYDDAIGKLTYTRRGDVWALVGPRTQTAAAGAIWYTGTASVRRRSGVVVHHVQYSSLASWTGTDLVRSFEFFARGKGLRLSAEVTPELTDVLEWRRAGARWAGPL